MDVDQQKALDLISSPIVAWFIFGFFLLIFAIVSIILLYHWKKYGFNSKHALFFETVYFPVAIILIGITSFALIMYATV